MASSGQQGKVGTPEDQILAGGGKQTPLRAQRDAMTLSQGTDCWYQAVSGDRNGPSVELVAPAAPGSALRWNWRLLDQSWSPAVVMHRETDSSSILTHAALPVAQHRPVPGIPARFHFPAQCGRFQPQMLSRAECESAGGRGSSCCHKLCSTPLPTSSHVMCPGCAQAGTTLPQLHCLQPKPFPASLHPSGNSLGTRSKRARWNKAGAELPGAGFPCRDTSLGAVCSLLGSCSLQAAPALGLSAPRVINLSLGVK